MASSKEYMAEWRKAHPEDKERVNARSAKWRKDHPKASTQWFREHRQRGKELARKATLKRHGLTPEQYDAMLERQCGRCAICEREPFGRWTTFYIDHDHVTGKVRGLLCHKCNAGIGLLLDSTRILLQAINYLTTYGKKE